jgi:N-acyl-D-amino-acid deacylase
MNGGIALRKSYWTVVVSCLLVTGLVGACSVDERSDNAFDLILENGRLVDGTGNPWYRADVGIKGKKIAAIGDLAEAEAIHRIDVSDDIISPGFIDMHSHASWKLLVDRRAASKITQGVTLEIEGEGESVAPMNDAFVEARRENFERFDIEQDWRSLDSYFRRLERTPPTVNFATYFGTENAREMTVGFEDRPATAEELDEMRRLTREAMEDGALGIFSALMYSPDRYNRTEELIEMAKVAAEYGGVYQSHIRSESNAIDAALEEVFRIAREAKIPAQVTHFKVTYKQNWGRMPEIVKKIKRAREAGLDITGDLYPYVRAGGAFTPLLPPWVQDGGRDHIVRRLKDPATRARIKEELANPASDWENEYYGAGGGPAGFAVTDAHGNPDLKPYETKTLAEIAEMEKKDPRDVVLDIVLAGDAGMTVLITDEDDMRLAMRRPWMVPIQRFWANTCASWACFL